MTIANMPNTDVLMTTSFGFERKANAVRDVIAIAALVCAIGAIGCRRHDPTFHEDVAPILAARCGLCHDTNGVALTPAMRTYEDVVRNADLIERSIRTRDMPPWGPDDTGLCGTFRDAPWLDASEIATFVGWNRRGRREGSPSRRPPPVPVKEVVLDGDVRWSETPEYAPGVGDTSYRCFIVDPALAEAEFLTGLTIASTEPRIVRQVTLFALESRDAEAQAEALDAEDEGPGYRCYGGTRTAAKFLTSWSWDARAVAFPRGTGLRLAPGRKVVAQVHYDVTAAGLYARSRTTFGLALAPSVTREARILPVTPREPFALPPGRARAEVVSEARSDRSLDVLAVSARMHGRGLTLEVERLRGEARACVANIERFVFGNQRQFEYATPLRAEAGDTFRAKCTFTTLGLGAPITMGEAIDQEECVAWLYVADR